LTDKYRTFQGYTQFLNHFFFFCFSPVRLISTVAQNGLPLLKKYLSLVH